MFRINVVTGWWQTDIITDYRSWQGSLSRNNIYIELGIQKEAKVILFPGLCFFLNPNSKDISDPAFKLALVYQSLFMLPIVLPVKIFFTCGLHTRLPGFRPTSQLSPELSLPYSGT
jgi:hypothetical protein